MLSGTEVHTGRDALNSYQDDWRRLEEHASFFQSWDWCDSWLRFYGRSLEPIIITAHNSGSITAIAPLVKSRFWWGMPIRRLMFIGTGISDYGGFIISETAEESADELISALSDIDFDLLDLHQVSEGAVAQFKTALDDAFTIKVLKQEPALAVALPDSIDAYLPQLSKKFRKNTVYSDRRLRRDFKYEERHYRNENDIEEAMRIFFKLHQSRWLAKRLPGLFVGRRNKDFHLDLAGRLASANRLILRISLVDGQPAAAFYGFKFGDAYSYYLGGFDPNLSKYSVSSVLILNLIKDALTDGARVFDFLRGEESYKFRWGARVEPRYRVLVYRPNPMGLSAATLAKWQNDLVQRGRARLHQ